MFIATLLCNPATPVLDRTTVESLRNAWGGGDAIWLDPGIADLEIRGRFNVADAMMSLDLIARTTGTRIIELPFNQYLLVR